METIKKLNKRVLENLEIVSDMIDGNKELVMDGRNMVEKSKQWEVWDRLNLANTALLRASGEVAEAIRWLKSAEDWAEDRDDD